MPQILTEDEHDGTPAARRRSLVMVDTGMPADEPIVALVEDEPLVRDLAACELMERGFKVVEFPTADEALPWLADHGGDLSIVVTDVQMPGRLNGLELVNILARLWPSLTVLVTSGGPLVDPRTLPPSARFVAKPWLPADLAARVERLAFG